MLQMGRGSKPQQVLEVDDLFNEKHLEYHEYLVGRGRNLSMSLYVLAKNNLLKSTHGQHFS